MWLLNDDQAGAASPTRSRLPSPRAICSIRNCVGVGHVAGMARVAMNRARTEPLWSINAMAAVDLTPGEALLLFEPNKRQGSEAIKVSLMWLLAKKCLTASLEDKPGFLG